MTILKQTIFESTIFSPKIFDPTIFTNDPRGPYSILVFLFYPFGREIEKISYVIRQTGRSQFTIVAGLSDPVPR